MSGSLSTTIAVNSLSQEQGGILTHTEKWYVITRQRGANDQDHRAGGRTRVIVEQPIILNEGTDVEKPKAYPDPVHRFVMAFVRCTLQ